MQRPLITTLDRGFRYTEVDWHIDWREQSPGVSTNGVRRIHIGALPRWVGTPTGRLFRDEIGPYRAGLLAGRGMTGIFRVRMSDAAVFFTSARPQVSFSDNATFSDGSGFANPATVLCVEGGASGATSLLVDDTEHPVTAGQIMSHDDWPFAVTSALPEGDHTRITFEMPLRVAIPDNSLLECTGVGLFEFVEQGSGRVAYGGRLVAEPQLTIQEWLR